MPKSNRIVNMIMNIAREEGADPIAMLATSKVESDWNPRSVGDGGTSYGLYQHHVGGAGGSTHEQAQRFLNPETSIRERARQFSRLGIRGGEGAASLQRPADPSGYAVKVNAEINRLRKQGPVSSSNRRSGRTTGDSVSSGSKPSGSLSMLLGMLYEDDPNMLGLWQGVLDKEEPLAADMDVPESPRADTSVGNKAIGGSYRQLQRIGQKRFGLQNDPGNYQTTGGKHVAGSNHRKGTAIDFGDARNSPSQLKAYANFLRKKHGSSIKELYYQPLGWSIVNGKVVKGNPAGGHGDHLHAAL